MNIWFLIWLCIAATLLYFFGWTLFILFRQKKSWKHYAEKTGLRYTPGKFSESPEMSGTIKDYTVSLFTGEHVLEDARKSSRRLTAVEIQLSSKFPFEGGVASGGMIGFIKELGFNAEIKPKHEKWNKSYIAISPVPYALESYLSDERLEALFSLMKIRNSWVILVFKDDMALLRIDLPDPLETPRKVNAIVNRMIEAAQVLELEPGESKKLKEDMARTSPRLSAIHVRDDEIDGSGLELDEENEDSSSEEKSQSQTDELDENDKE